MPIYGMGYFLGLGGSGPINPTSLSLSGLWLPDYVQPTWSGTASKGTSFGQDLKSPIYAASSSFALKSFLRAPLTTSPFVGQTSGGTSGTQNWDDNGGLTPPNPGAGLNGQGTIHFIAANSQYITASNGITTGLLDSLVSNSASSGWLLFNTATLVGDSATVQNNDPFLCDAGQFYGITASIGTTTNSGIPYVSFFITSGAAVVSVSQNITINDWQLVQWYHSGTTIGIRTMSATNKAFTSWVTNSTGVGNIDAGFVGQPVHMGFSVTSGIYGDFDFADGGLINSTLSLAQFDSQALDIQETYAIFFDILAAPTAANPLNNHVGANFSRTDSGLKKTSGFVSDQLGANTYYYSFFFYSNNGLTPTGNIFDDPLILGDFSGNFGLTFTSSGCTAFQYDATTGWTGVSIAASTNNWHFVQVWHDGTNLWIQVDNKTPGQIAIPMTWFAANYTAMNFHMGMGAYKPFNGIIVAACTSLTQLGATQRLGLGKYFQNYFNTPLGF